MSASLLVLITGVSRGLGAALARGFVRRGWRVAGCARSAGSLERLALELGEGALLRPADVADETSVVRFAGEVLSTFGAPDLLLNNAAVINRPAPVWELDDDEITSLIDINVTGSIRVLRHFLPAMIQRDRGVAVNFSSGWGRSTSPEVASYCASKWAIEGLTRALASELPSGLAAVAFNPGIIDTEMLRTCFGESATHYPDAEEWAETAVPYLASLGPRDNGKAVTCPGQ